MKNKKEFLALYENLKDTEAWQDMGLMNKHFAEMLGVSERTLYRYLSGDVAIPQTVILLLRFLLRDQKVS